MTPQVSPSRGFVPSTVADDGDPLDILVATYDPAFPAA